MSERVCSRCGHISKRGNYNSNGWATLRLWRWGSWRFKRRLCLTCSNALVTWLSRTA